MKTLLSLAILALLSGCASWFTPKPPVIEDKVGLWLNEPVGTLATSADYRVVYVRLNESAKLCAEAPADAASNFASAFAGVLSAPLAEGKAISAETRTGLAVAIKQLFKRSQGVQLYRDGAFALCNMYLNGAIDGALYLSELKELRMAAKDLISVEIPHLEKITIDPVEAPNPPRPEDSKKDSTSAAGE